MSRNFIGVAFASATATMSVTSFAGIGPCNSDARGNVLCGSGEGAANVIVKTISPSKRIAFAWRLANRPPTDVPEEKDSALENLIVRLSDGAVLAKSRGSYWDLGTKIAKAYLFVAWSPDSRWFVKVEQRENVSSMELFSFSSEGDATTGPIDLVNTIKTAMLAKIPGVSGAGDYHVIFASHPEMKIDDQGLLEFGAFVRASDAADHRPYVVTLQVIRRSDRLDAGVVAIKPYDGASISIIVH